MKLVVIMAGKDTGGNRGIIQPAKSKGVQAVLFGRSRRKVGRLGISGLAGALSKEKQFRLTGRRKFE